jgi:hypothetical protein
MNMEHLTGITSTVPQKVSKSLTIIGLVLIITLSIHSLVTKVGDVVRYSTHHFVAFNPNKCHEHEPIIIPNLIHYLLIGLSPIPVYGLVSIDTVARHMPNATINIFITVPVDTPEEILEASKSVLYK